jgi:hypothetical protein
MIGVAAAGIVALYLDFTSDGLRGTLMFRSIGYMVYPLFYGGVAYLLYRYGSHLTNGGAYLTASANSITVGGKTFASKDLQFSVRRNWLGLREIEFLRRGRREFAVKAYYLARPAAEVIAELNRALAGSEAPVPGASAQN